MKQIQNIKENILTLDHLNIGMVVLALIAFTAIAILFIMHSKALLSHVSGSLKDPNTGNWSPKILSAFAATLLIVLMHGVWLKSSFITGDFSQLQNILLIDYGYLTVAYGLRTVEKMQAKKIDGKDETTNTDNTNTPIS